jgi:hypothetical protein
MSVHFAAARCATRSPLARILSRGPVAAHANDNGPAANTPLIDCRTRDALLHFAEHGLHAATVAAERASDAAANEDAEGYERWIALCDTLDSAMATRLRKQSRDDYLIG